MFNRIPTKAHAKVDPAGYPSFGKSHSLVSKHLSQDVYGSLATRTTSSGFTIDRLIQAGIDHPDAEVGAFAGDAVRTDKKNELIKKQERDGLLE